MSLTRVLAAHDSDFLLDLHHEWSYRQIDKYTFELTPWLVTVGRKSTDYQTVALDPVSDPDQVVEYARQALGRYASRKVGDQIICWTLLQKTTPATRDQEAIEPTCSAYYPTIRRAICKIRGVTSPQTYPDRLISNRSDTSIDAYIRKYYTFRHDDDDDGSDDEGDDTSVSSIVEVAGEEDDDDDVTMMAPPSSKSSSRRPARQMTGKRSRGGQSKSSGQSRSSRGRDNLKITIAQGRVGEASECPASSSSKWSAPDSSLQITRSFSDDAPSRLSSDMVSELTDNLSHLAEIAGPSRAEFLKSIREEFLPAVSSISRRAVEDLVQAANQTAQRLHRSMIKERLESTGSSSSRVDSQVADEMPSIDRELLSTMLRDKYMDVIRPCIEQACNHLLNHAIQLTTEAHQEAVKYLRQEEVDADTPISSQEECSETEDDDDDYNEDEDCDEAAKVGYESDDDDDRPAQKRRRCHV